MGLLKADEVSQLVSRTESQYTVSSENAAYMSRQGYATCHRRSPSAGERLTNMRDAVMAAHMTHGIAKSAGRVPLHVHSCAQVPRTRNGIGTAEVVLA